MEVALAHQDYAGRKRRNYRSNDFRTRLLEWLRQNANPKLEGGRASEADLKAIAGKIDVVGRIALPHRQNHVDGFGENLVAIFIQYSDRLRIRGERARADAHYESTPRQMIEHCRVDRDYHRMHLRQVGGAGRKLDVPCFVDQRGLEHHAVGNVLARVGEVFADEGIVKAELVGEDY